MQHDLIGQLLTAWNTHNADNVAACYADDYEGEDVAEAQRQHGAADMRASAARYLRAFPDIEFTPSEIIADGNRLVMVWFARGTHAGPILDIPPSGRSINVRGVSVLTTRDGKIVRALYIWDLAGLLRNVSLLPDL